MAGDIDVVEDFVDLKINVRGMVVEGEWAKRERERSRQRSRERGREGEREREREKERERERERQETWKGCVTHAAVGRSQQTQTRPNTHTHTLKRLCPPAARVVLYQTHGAAAHP